MYHKVQCCTTTGTAGWYIHLNDMHAAINIPYTASVKTLLQPCLLQSLYGQQWNLALTAPTCAEVGDFAGRLS